VESSYDISLDFMDEHNSAYELGRMIVKAFNIEALNSILS
jgi:hypothetical protein